MDLNRILTGADADFDFQTSGDPDLKEIHFNGRTPTTLEGGYRILNDKIVEGIVADDTKADLEGLLGLRRTVGVAKINLQTNNYTRKRRGRNGEYEFYPLAAFPCDEAVEYGKVQNDTTDGRRVYPRALVIGSLDKAVTAAVKWRQSDRYLLIPYIANMYNVSGGSAEFHTSNGATRRLRWVAGQSVHICLGGITSGNLSDWAFNSDLMLNYDVDSMMPYPPGFLPVFVPQYGDNPLRRLQDAELARVLAGFMPSLHWEHEYDVIRKLLCEYSPETELAVERYKDGAGELPAWYRENRVYDQVYELYTKILAHTFLNLWENVRR